jgi:ribosomal protein S18 acetylase RimI-like enzyme
VPDLLVPLYRLPPIEPRLGALRTFGIVVRRARTYELTTVSDFINVHFGRAWADENAVAISRQPVCSFIAIETSTDGGGPTGKIVGFGTFESTARAYFGPTGVAPSHQGRGIGTSLLLACLHGLHELGYAYGIIGGAGPVDFYRKTVNAIVIPDSTPGIYADRIG